MALLAAALLFFYGCSSAPGLTKDGARVESNASGDLRIAVLPVANFSNGPAPLKEINREWIRRLKEKGLHLIDAQVTERVITDHRIRYTSGLNPDTALTFKTQAKADAVLVAMLERYNEGPPPSIALNARLISTARQPRILWIDSIGMAGNDAPGLLDLGLIEDPALLMRRALSRLSGSLGDSMAGNNRPASQKQASSRFRPQMAFHTMSIDPGRTYRVAVVPFFNLSERQRAGDFVALMFAGALNGFKNFTIIEPGTLRQQLLDLRIIMPSGISLANADLVFDRLDADLILNGEVLDYQDTQTAGGSPRVDFSAQFIERKSREVVWTVKSQNTGDDGVLIFGMGKANTAHELARRMVARAVEGLLRQ